MSTLELLFENEIPAGRQALQDSHHNLQDVANYCEDNYLKAADKRRALEETKNFTTQSLASVAYQINTLATSMLQMLDLQATQLANMESSINHIAQNVAIHKEKVARREIGVLTTNKNCPRTHKVITPSNPEKQMKYKSTPINYGALDDLGHGLKLSSPAGTRSRTDSQASTSTSNSGGGGYEALPIYQPPKPEENPYNSMRRRLPNHPPVAPTVPQQYMSIGRTGPRDSQQGAPARDRPSIQAYMQQGPPGSVPPAGQQMADVPAPPPAPPTGMPGVGMHPGMVPPPPPTMGIPPPSMMGQPQQNMRPHPPTTGPPAPPAPPMMSMPPAPAPVAPPPPASQQGPPPMDFNSQLNQAIGMRPASGDAQRNSLNPYGEVGMPPPPDMGGDLPPPPMDSMQPYGHDSVVMPPPPEFETMPDEGDCVPAAYVEKVVAVYDYGADREDELSFEEGAIIYVMKKNEDGWYEGVCNGQTGLFPGNYVELCP